MKTMNPPAIVRKVETTLAMRAKRINKNYDACLDVTVSGLEFARAMGEDLAASKEEVCATQGHTWLRWLEANVPRLSERQAQRYTRLFREWDHLFSVRSSDMTLGGALDLLTGDSQDAPQLDPWETRPADRLTVAGDELSEEEALAACELLEEVPLAERTPEEQREAIEQEKAENAQRLQTEEECEQVDDRTLRLKQGGTHVEKARRRLLGLGHEADRLIKHLDRAMLVIAELEAK